MNIEDRKTGRIITRPILIVSGVSLLTDVASEMLYPIMPMFLQSIGFSIIGIGVLEGFVEAFAGISKGYFGQLSDRIGRRVPFIRFGYGLSAIAKPLMAIFAFPIGIFLLRSVERLGKGIRTSARDAYLSDLTTREHKGRVFGFHRSMDTLGAAMGPALALIILYFLPEQYRLLFVISVIPGMLAVLFTLLLREKVKSHKQTERKSFFGFLSYWKTASKDYKLLIIGLLAFTLFNSSDAFLLLTLKSNGFEDTQVIGFYIFFNLIYALSSYPIGRLSDKIGQKTILVFGLSLFVIVYGSFGFASGIWQFALLFLIYGIFASSTEGVSKALISNISAKNQTATALGFYNSFASLGVLFGSTITGLIWTVWSMKAAFVLSAAGALIVIVYFSLFLGLREKSVNPE
ncbi:MAG: ABC transporter permease [Bacteroidetes bacterium GWF2_49_14]|nr:MAG: ABC transporter permease [Bacteroidetes bacterium GWF2_49_14]HBB92731.1 MFS transporter [Bacteroidales bacterium]